MRTENTIMFTECWFDIHLNTFQCVKKALNIPLSFGVLKLARETVFRIISLLKESILTGMY